jgi:acetyltransferase-like isoleucine patch superfamily enzyme
METDQALLVNLERSYSLRESLSEGLVVIDPSAIVSEGVRIVPREDDGSSAGPIRIGAGCRIRDGCMICSGVQIGAGTMVGHYTVLRRGVRIGQNSVIHHLVSIQHEVQIGNSVRVSALTHLTGGCIIEDDVQIGARVVTVDDNDLLWRKGATLTPPVLRRGCRIGSGVTLMGGIEIGPNTLVGAGAVVTRSLPAGVVAYGVPAYVQRDLADSEVRASDRTVVPTHHTSAARRIA